MSTLSELKVRAQGIAKAYREHAAWQQRHTGFSDAGLANLAALAEIVAELVDRQKTTEEDAPQ